MLFHAISYIGAFPFLQDAPAVLGLDQLVVVVTIMTDRFRRVLAKGSADRMKLLFKSLAVYDRRLSEAVAPERPLSSSKKGSAASVAVESPVAATARGFAIDEAGEDDAENDENDDMIAAEDDDLVMAAFESLDLVDVFRHGNTPTIHGAMIPVENLQKLLMLLLLAAPLDPQEHLSQYADRVAGKNLEHLRAVAGCVLSSFLDTEQSPGVKFGTFKRVIPVCFPHMFDGLNGLFTRFLFSKSTDFSRQKKTDSHDPQSPAKAEQPQMAAPLLLDQDKASILDANVMSQLSFFIPGSTLFRRMRLLYSGEEDGFSMGSFESKVFNWRAPTVLLVRGRRLGDRPEGTQEHAFADSLPPRRFPDGSGGGEDEELTFGAYVAQPWRHTHRECFGDEQSILFQLAPVHDVFHASVLNKDYAAFVKASPSAFHPGVAFGCPPPKTSSKASSSSVSLAPVALGSVSLFLDSSFEFGVFTHDHGRRGGAFTTSVVRRRNLQDRFAIESLEVWGCGGDEEAKIQAERWAWEAREAEARRRINLGTGDRDADRALLEMAGLVGQNRSGGSMG